MHACSSYYKWLLTYITTNMKQHFVTVLALVIVVLFLVSRVLLKNIFKWCSTTVIKFFLMFTSNWSLVFKLNFFSPIFTASPLKKRMACCSTMAGTMKSMTSLPLKWSTQKFSSPSPWVRTSQLFRQRLQEESAMGSGTKWPLNTITG